MGIIFGKDEPHSQYDNVVFVRTAYDNVQASVIESLLRAEEIPYMIKERGSGSSAKLIAGFSVFGTDFFVDKRDGPRAIELLNAMLDGKETEDAEAAEDSGDEVAAGDPAEETEDEKKDGEASED